jgi:hypothetical protein
MGAETGGQPVADEANRRKRMCNLVECRLRAAASKTGESDAGVHPRKIRTLERCVLGCGRARSHDRTPRLVDSKPRRCRPRQALTEHRVTFILKPSAAAAAAAVNPEV